MASEDAKKEHKNKQTLVLLAGRGSLKGGRRGPGNLEKDTYYLELKDSSPALRPRAPPGSNAVRAFNESVTVLSDRELFKFSTVT